MLPAAVDEYLPRWGNEGFCVNKQMSDDQDEELAERPPTFDPTASVKAIKYEYDMALATAWHGTRKWEDTAVEFALLESFLVHARNLHDLLRPRTKKSRRLPW